MEKTVYSAICSALKSGTELDDRLFNNSPSDTMRFTVKNYNQPMGLS